MSQACSISRPRLDRKNLFWALVIAVGIAGFFWTQSRYPALVGKYEAGGAIEVSGNITFGTVFETDASQPLWQRVLYTTVNWVDANKKGMTFGVLFGAALLTVLKLLPRTQTKNRHVNALLGMLTGAPLGVCSNCVAPIGKGMYQSGTATETALATMFSSPTLNVIVVAMLFALFPMPVAITKLALTVVFILLIIPFLARFHTSTSAEEESASGACQLATAAAASTSWTGALKRTVAQYGSNLAFLAWRTVPFMLLGGALGALFVELLPANIWQLTPTFIVILAASLIGTFLPIPIAFDVAFAYTLYSAGAPLPVVMALLFTLGIYSVYSSLIVATTMSLRMAATLFATVTIMGVASAYVLDVVLGLPFQEIGVIAMPILLLAALLCAQCQLRVTRALALA